MPFSIIAPVLGVAGAIYGADKSSDAQQNAVDSQAATAANQTQLGQEQLDFAEQQYNDAAPARTAALTSDQQLSDAQLQGMQFATSQAQEDQNYYDTTYKPLEQSLVSSAQTYDTPEKEAAAAEAASADVNQSADATNAANERDLARSGIAPGSGKAMSLMQDASVAQAAAAAGAGTTAARNVQQQGYARELDAASLGRNLPSAQATQESIASNTGTAGVGANTGALNATTTGVSGVNTGYSGAVAAGGSAGSLYGSAAGGYNTINSAITSGFGNLGKAVGSGQFTVPSSIAGMFGAGSATSPSGQAVYAPSSDDDSWNFLGPNKDGGPIALKKKPKGYALGGGVYGWRGPQAIVQGPMQRMTTMPAPAATLPVRGPAPIPRMPMAASGPVPGMTMQPGADPTLGASWTATPPAAAMPAPVGGPTAMPAPARAPVGGGNFITAGGNYAKGGAVLPGIMTAAAAPVVRPVARTPKGLPRGIGSPAAPANVGAYQATPLNKKMAFRGGGMVEAVGDYRAGGPAIGPGGPRADKILARVSDGEHVLKTSTVTKIGNGSNARGQRKLIAATHAIDNRRAA